MSTTIPAGATPLDPDEARALIPSHISTQAQLNEWEHDNIVEGERWAFARRRSDLLTERFLKRLHQKMFGATWRWTGHSQGVRQLLQDVTAQLERHSYPVREIAARLHHRLVQIHPFPNGNGRVARTYADLLLVSRGEERFRWGSGDRVAALQAADRRDYGPLLRFLEVQNPAP